MRRETDNYMGIHVRDALPIVQCSPWKRCISYRKPFDTRKEQHDEAEVFKSQLLPDIQVENKSVAQCVDEIIVDLRRLEHDRVATMLCRLFFLPRNRHAFIARVLDRLAKHAKGDRYLSSSPISEAVYCILFGYCGHVRPLLVHKLLTAAMAMKHVSYLTTSFLGIHLLAECISNHCRMPVKFDTKELSEEDMRCAKLTFWVKEVAKVTSVSGCNIMGYAMQKIPAMALALANGGARAARRAIEALLEAWDKEEPSAAETECFEKHAMEAFSQERCPVTVGIALALSKRFPILADSVMKLCVTRKYVSPYGRMEEDEPIGKLPTDDEQASVSDGAWSFLREMAAPKAAYKLRSYKQAGLRAMCTTSFQSTNYATLQGIADGYYDDNLEATMASIVNNVLYAVHEHLVNDENLLKKAVLSEQVLSRIQTELSDTEWDIQFADALLRGEEAEFALPERIAAILEPVHFIAALKGLTGQDGYVNVCSSARARLDSVLAEVEVQRSRK